MVVVPPVIRPSPVDQLYEILLPVELPVPSKVAVGVVQFTTPGAEATAVGGVKSPGIVTIAVAVQPFASVAVTVKGPGSTPVKVAPVWPFDHEKLKLGVPPEPVAVAPPPIGFKQFAPIGVPMEAVNRGGAAMVKDWVAVQPSAEVLVTEYVPGASMVGLLVVPAEAGFQT